MERVIEFHLATGQPVDEDYTKERFKFRAALMIEECEELIDSAEAVEAYEDPEELKVALAHTLKEMCDVMYVIKGTAAAFGWDLEEAFDRVCKNNMTKVDPLNVHPVTGKILKPANYQQVILEDLV